MTVELTGVGAGLEGYAMLAAQVEALLAGERNLVANAAQLSAFIYQEVPDLNWAGFYFVEGEDQLLLGPFQGKVACMRIPFSKGVCGAAARLRRLARGPRAGRARAAGAALPARRGGWIPRLPRGDRLRFDRGAQRGRDPVPAADRGRGRHC